MINVVAGTLKFFAHTKSLNQASDILYLVESRHGKNGHFVRMVGELCVLNKKWGN